MLVPIFLTLLIAAVSVVLPSGTVRAASGLDISKSSSADIVESGETFDYRILVSCSSSTGDGVDAQVVDVLPPELSGAASDVFLAPVIGVDASHDEPSRTITWTFTNDLGGAVGLAAGSSVELLASVEFPPGSTPDGTVADNQATLRRCSTRSRSGEGRRSHRSTPPSTTPSSNRSAPAGAGKASATWITLGQPFDFILSIDSTGFLPITDVVLIDTLPVTVDATSISIRAGADRVFYASGDDPTRRPVTFTPVRRRR